MPTFKLTQDAIARLSMKFEEFRRERETVEGLLADYSRFEGPALARQEYLEEKYSHRAPALSHLVWNEDGEVCWNVPDIAIILGRQRPSITRAFERMEKEDGWNVRLLALRRDAKASNGLPVHVYHQDIFNLLIDRYEEEYLRRFAAPRRGDRENAPDIEEVRRFWSYLKDAERIRSAYAALEGEQEESSKDMSVLPDLPKLPPMRWRDVLSLIWRRIFTIQTGTLFSILFAVSFELVRRWPWLLPWTVGTSVTALAVCAGLLRLRRGTPGTIAGIGAGALLFTLLWSAGLLSPDGFIRSPGGAALALTARAQQAASAPANGPEDFLRQIKEPWVTTRSFVHVDKNGKHIPSSVDGVVYVELDHQLLLSPAGDAVKAVVYGVNTEQPDTVLSKENMNARKGRLETTLLIVQDGSVKYVTSRLILRDGTSSEIRRDDVKPKPVVVGVDYIPLESSQ